jgi:acyl-CoA synthetase (AMP-forming)/AMP-acid ligase II
VRRPASALAAWNHHRHLEAYFAIPAMGAVLHAQPPPPARSPGVRHQSRQPPTIIVDEDLLPLLEVLTKIGLGFALAIFSVIQRNMGQ